MRLVSWNMAHQQPHWRELTLDEKTDVVLLQEAVPPSQELDLETIPPRNEAWVTDGASRRFCAAVARLSDRVEIRQIPTKPLTELTEHELGVSLGGTIAACEITDEAGETIVAASMYGLWERPVPRTESSWIYADASVHRVISDLSALIATQRRHKVIVAGDLTGHPGGRREAGVFANEGAVDRAVPPGSAPAPARRCRFARMASRMIEWE